jgi:hypothetical protein
MNGNRWLVPVVLAAVLVLAPSVALARISGRIVENVGIKAATRTKTASLGLHETTDTHRLGWSYRRVVDHNYAYTVYKYLFGKKSSKSGHYPLEMYSKKSNHHVFTFIVYSPLLVTKNRTHVGTGEDALKSRYGSRVTKWPASNGYTYYSMHAGSGLTEFWCKSGKVHHIVIAKL